MGAKESQIPEDIPEQGALAGGTWTISNRLDGVLRRTNGEARSLVFEDMDVAGEEVSKSSSNALSA